MGYDEHRFVAVAFGSVLYQEVKLGSDLRPEQDHKP